MQMNWTNFKKIYNMKMWSFIFTLLPFFAFSQIKSEHILSYSKLINPAFSKNASQINASFDKNSIIGNESDAKYFVKFEISEKKAELSGSSANFNIGSAVAGFNSFNLLGSLLSSSAGFSNVYAFKNFIGNVFLNKDNFDTLFNYSTFIRNQIEKDNIKGANPITYYFKIDKIELSLDVYSGKDLNVFDNVYSYSQRNIILKIDDAIFAFTDREFIKFHNDFLVKVKSLWK